jgi:hypothetical protein
MTITKQHQNVGYFCNKKLPKLDNNPIFENSRNLVTLVCFEPWKKIAKTNINKKMRHYVTAVSATIVSS